MKLSTNSFSAKLYRWFYNQNEMPNNLCPYFWKLVMMYLLIVPYVILTIPSQIVFKFEKQDFSKNLGVSVGLYLLMFGLVLFISVPTILLFDLSPNDFWERMFGGGLMLWAFLIFAGIYHGIKFLFSSIKNWNNPKKMYDSNGYAYYGFDENGNKIYYLEQKPNILVEFVKAKYNKYCPKIDWNK